MLNTIHIMGRLVADPELRKVSEETILCKFRIAVDRRRKQDGTHETDFFNCSAWKGTGETIAKWFKKGDVITITGRLRSDTYEKNGEKRTSVEIVVEEFFFTMSKLPESSSAADTASAEDLAEFEEILNDSEIPF